MDAVTACDRPGSRAGRTPTVGVLLAGGSGTRTGLDYPKQFLRIGGRTVLEHTLAAFQASPLIDEIVVVIARAWIDVAEGLVVSCGADKVSAVIAGGATRNESTLGALTRLAAAGFAPETRILIHDAVRPLVSADIIERCVVALDEHDAVDVVVDADDTIVEVRDDRLVRIPPRATLRRGQTPQAFRLGVLRAAYAAHGAHELAGFTDDCAVVMSAFPQLPIVAVHGSVDNLKITRAIDIYLADRLLQLAQATPPAVAGGVRAGAVAVIGGSSGIGAATVARLDALGYRAVSLSRRDGGVDVRDEGCVRDALQAVRRELGPLAGVINCAGVLTPGALLSAPATALYEQLEVNLTGSIHVARAAHDLLAETGGHLVLFTSSSYTRGRGGYATYSATKAAIVNLAQALAEEWCDSTVKVNCVNPARTDTPMRARAFGCEEPDSLLDAGAVADAVAAILATSASGHVYDVRLTPTPTSTPVPTAVGVAA